MKLLIMKNLIKLKKIVSLLILLSVSINISAQLENSNWYFGNQAGINFNDETSDPSALTDGVMRTDGGSASISDANGNLLFYTNGITVWGADHKTLKNGTGLFGSSTVSQAVLIVPNPSEENEYYIFTNQAQEAGSKGLNYSIVKLTEKGDDYNDNDDDDDNDDNHDDNNDDDDDDDNSNSSSKLNTGVVNGVSSSWKTVTLPNNYSSMVVVTTPNYTLSQKDPMVVRVRNASGNTFQIRAESAGGTVSAIDVHYMVVEEGVYDGMEAVKYNSTVTDQDNSWKGETRSYANSYTNPVVLGQVMTSNDEDFSTFWSYGDKRTNPPNSSYLRTGKHVAQDSDTSRNNETIGYVVIEAGKGNLNGIGYTAAVGSDKVTQKEYEYSISQPGANVAIATITAMDGSDGGWAVLSSDSAVSETGIKLSIDEDIIKDSETNHTTEQVAYIVFGNKSDDNDDDDDGDDDDDDYEYCNDQKTKVSICHKGKNTLCVSINALQAHLDHGDSLGSCNDDDKEYEYSITSKNIPLLPYASEKLTAVYNQDNDSYWVVSFAPDSDYTHNDTFYAFKIDDTGVNLKKKSNFTFFPMNTENTGGQMKITADHKKLGMVHNTMEVGRDGGLEGLENVFTFDFDRSNGTVSSMMVHTLLFDQLGDIKLTSSANGFDDVHVLLSGQDTPKEVISSVNGFEFSPDGDKFYISTKEQVNYDLLNVSSNINIYQILYRNLQNYDPNYSPLKQLSNNLNKEVFSLQLGIDDKIYGVNNSGNLIRISNPNGLDYTARYENSSISLNGKSGSKGLPQLIQNRDYNSSNRLVETKRTVVQGNPFKNELVIDLTQLRSVEVYDERGALIKLVVFNDSNERKLYNLDTSDLAVGIYFLVIKDENSRVYNEKVFKVD